MTAPSRLPFLLRAALPALALTLAVPAQAGWGEKKPFTEVQGWGAYLKDEKGEKYNITDPIEKIDDKLWMGLQWTPYRGPRLIMSVLMVDNRSGKLDPKASPNSWANSWAEAMVVARTGTTNEVPVAAIEDMLTTAFKATGRFRILERKKLDDIMAEKRLDASKDEAPAVSLQKNLNKTITAPYTIQGSVTEWTPDKSKKGGNLGALVPGALGGLGLSKSEAEVAMNFRIIDTRSSEVIHALTIRAKAGNWGMSFGAIGAGAHGVAGGSGSMQEKSPINYAVTAAINKAAYQISQALGNKPWRGSVTQVSKDGKIILNGGEDTGLEVGMELNALQVGDEIKDPETGEILGKETTEFGKIKITSVKERFAYASVVNGCQGIKTGDMVEMPPKRD